jgi:hypothetical protein
VVPNKLPEWPRNERHPETGEPFAEVIMFAVRRKVALPRLGQPPRLRTVRSVSPSPPSRFVEAAWDEDDNPIDFRRLDDAEFADAEHQYVARCVEWELKWRTAFSEAGPPIVEATFVCKSGALARGRPGKTGWKWLASNVPGRDAASLRDAR